VGWVFSNRAIRRENVVYRLWKMGAECSSMFSSD
jgi:hypothetical protein